MNKTNPDKTMSAAVYRLAYTQGVLDGFAVNRPSNLSEEICIEIEQSVIQQINYPNNQYAEDILAQQAREDDESFGDLY